MTDRDRARLWDWINEYVRACGGVPAANPTYERRMVAVAGIEDSVRRIEASVLCPPQDHGTPEDHRLLREYLYLKARLEQTIEAWQQAQKGQP